MVNTTEVLLRRHGTQKESVSLLSVINEEIQTKGYKRLSACAAYASYRGVIIMRAEFGDRATQFRWLFGLDDTGDGTQLGMSISRVGSARTERMIRLSKETGFVESSVAGPSGRLFGWY